MLKKYRSFRLTRYLSLASLLGVVAAAVVLGQLYRHFATDQLTQNEQRHNLELAKYFATAIWPEFGPFLSRLQGSDGDAIRRDPRTTALNARVRDRLQGSRVLEVSLFDRQGLTVYSTDPEQIGIDRSGVGGFETAKQGRPVSLTSERARFHNASDDTTLRDRNLLTSYAPIRDDQGQVVAVVEMYNDITPLMNEIARSHGQLIAATILVMLALYSTLFCVIKRAESIIRDKARAQAQHQANMQHQANHDALTGLPNRRHFRELLSERMANAECHEYLLAVLFIDLDGFKPINDTLGHQAGDTLLQEITARLKDSCRDSDVVSRIGGDEFTVILDRLEHVRNIDNAATRLLDSINQPIRLAGKELSVGASIGVAIYPFDDEDIDALIKHADTAMYAAKDAGRNRYHYYAQHMNEARLLRLELERDLRNALRLEQLEIHYQPRLSLVSGETIAVEALLRWHHPEHGLIPPDTFIPAAEDTGLIQSIGCWVLQQACRQISALRVDHPHLGLSINVSARQLQDQHFQGEIERTLAATGMQADSLELELTESTLMRNCEDAVATLQSIKHTGVMLALDDFGTGYSSLSYLRRLPLDTVKIDRSFINGVTENPRDAALANSIVDIGRRLGLRVVAEGVETEAQLAFVRDCHCHEAQGYLIAKPMPLSALRDFLGERTQGRAAG